METKKQSSTPSSNAETMPEIAESNLELVDEKNPNQQSLETQLENPSIIPQMQQAAVGCVDDPSSLTSETNKESSKENFESESSPSDSQGSTMETHEHSAIQSSSTEAMSEGDKSTSELVDGKDGAPANEQDPNQQSLEPQFVNPTIPQMQEGAVGSVDQSLTSETNEESSKESFESESTPSDSQGSTMETQEHSAISTEAMSEGATSTSELVDGKDGAPADEQDPNQQSLEPQLVNPIIPQMQESAVGSVDQSLTSETNEESLKKCTGGLTLLKTSKKKRGGNSIDAILERAPLDLCELKYVHLAKSMDVSLYRATRVAPRAPSVNADERIQGAPKCKFQLQFKQPVSSQNFWNKVLRHKVSLESVEASGLKLFGMVRVQNLKYKKQVTVIYTLTNWKTYTELSCDYDHNSHDGFSDKFVFTIYLPNLCPNQKIELYIKYVVNGQEYLDNNYGDNYCLRSKLD